MYRLLFILMTFFLSNGICSQQNITIGGRVTDDRGQPLPYANVFIAKLDLGAVANHMGMYQLERVAPGQYTVRASLIGFTGQDLKVNVGDKNITGLDFVLKEKTQDLDEVVVRGKSQASKLQESAQAVTVVRTETVKLQTADLGEVMAKTEGVSVQRAGGLGSGARFALGGLSGDQIRFFYNGIPLDFSPYAFGLANVPVNAIERVEVYKGVVPIQFGADALGGAVNLVSPKTNKKIGGSASYQTGSFGTHRATANIEHYNGITGFFAMAGGFFDYTDNNYKIDVAIPNERGQLSQETVERFHDAYRAFGVNFDLGVRNKKWAKELSLGAYYGDYDNEVQNSQAPGLINEPDLGIENAVAGRPFGEVNFTSFSTGANLHYNVEFSQKWNLDLRAGYNYSERESFDVTNNRYNWFGEIVRQNIIPGEFGDADNLITISESLFARQQVSFAISDKHSLNLSIAPTLALRTADDLLVDGPFDPALDDGRLMDLVSGLEHKMELLDNRLQNVAFVKNYHQDIRIESVDASVEGTIVDERSVNNFGLGNGLRYDWSERLSTKLSYEFAYRLPRLDEIFGDGQLIIENLGLRPESSHNFNLQWKYGSKPATRLQWQLEGNFFLRRIDDLIFFVPVQDDLGSFQNVWSASSQGVELGVRLQELIKGLTLSANTTYQEYRNTSDMGPFEPFRGDRIPNTPFFFANGSAEYGLNSLFKEGDDISLFWNVRHVGSFFVSWESVGLREFKAEVPEQTLQTLGLTYRMKMKNIHNAITLESQNLTDAKVFDFFGVQRPGRAVFVKLTTQF